MNTVTFILGTPASGNTTMALELAKQNENGFVYVSPFQNRRFTIAVKYAVLKQQTIIIEDAISISDLKHLITTDTINVFGVERFRPPVIITSNIITSNDIRPRPHFNIITIPSKQHN